MDEQTGKTFRIFNELLYDDVPTYESLCFEPVFVMYPWHFFPKGPEAGNLELPNPNVLDRAIKTARDKHLVTIIDIEHWPVSRADDAIASTSIRNYLTVLQQFQKTLPELTIGYYGVVPVIDRFRSTKPWDDARYRSWVAENTKAGPIADAADALFPSFYTVSLDEDRWFKMAEAQMAEARRLADGKPVYPFIWPNYHEQGGKFPKGAEVNADFWRRQLEFLRKNADGFVLWGGNSQPWNEDMPWWRETLFFLSSYFEKRANTLAPEAPQNLKELNQTPSSGVR
ncbi:hypothetical protein BH24PSE2_BH24PSE2_18930 [soil metagenome]